MFPPVHPDDDDDGGGDDPGGRRRRRFDDPDDDDAIIELQPMTTHGRIAARAVQRRRVMAKLAQLVNQRPFSAGVVEHQIDRLLSGREAA